MAAPKGNKYAAGNPGGGRPSSYKPEYAAQAAKACEAGFTDKELAELFGVAVRTINEWKLAHQDFSAALKPAKDIADDRVERCLYHRAVGYSFESEKVFQFQGEIVRTPTVEHVPPDTTAAIFWLKNRRKDKWRDRHEHEVGNPGDFDRMTDDELRNIIATESRALLGSDERAAEEGNAGLARGSRRTH